jgi:hypothetical protein
VQLRAIQVIAMGNKRNFLELWQQIKAMPKKIKLQQCLISWLKYVEDHDIGWIGYDASMMTHNKLYV